MSCCIKDLIENEEKSAADDIYCIWLSTQWNSWAGRCAAAI